MEYSLRDYLVDISFNYNLDLSNGEHELNSSPLPPRIALTKKKLSSFVIDLLELNKVLRVSSEHYKLHKSYPSPRSLYPLHLYVVYQNELLTMDSFTGEVYYCDALDYKMENDIFIFYEDKYPHFYKSIKKSLLLLEIGHLLYNVKAILEVHGGATYELYLIESGLQLSYQSGRFDDLNSRSQMILRERFFNRRSGSYLANGQYLIAPLSSKGCSLDKKELFKQEVLFPKFQKQLSKLIICQYLNNGEGLFQLSDSNSYEEKLRSSLSYIHFNTSMPYFNFRGVSSIILFFVKNHKVSDEHMEEVLLTMGMLAQHYSLSFSHQYRTRPIKSVGTTQMSERVGLDPGAYTAFYGLVIF